MGIPGRIFASFWLLLLLFGAATVTVARAATDPPVRETTIVVSYTQYEWWLSSWDANEIACVIVVDHEELPTGQEIYKACGSQIYDEWQNTPPCYELTDIGGNCERLSRILLPSGLHHANRKRDPGKVAIADGVG